ncbi:MAG: hypothetical protein AAFR59_19030, partial [Bacteroidota bacterium]
MYIERQTWEYSKQRCFDFPSSLKNGRLCRLSFCFRRELFRVAGLVLFCICLSSLSTLKGQQHTMKLYLDEAIHMAQHH